MCVSGSIQLSQIFILSTAFVAVHKVCHAIFGQFSPHLPFVTHPGTPKSTSHISDPPFLVGLVEKPDTNPLYKFSLNCSQRFLSWGFCPGVFSLKGFVRGGFCPFPHLSKYICYNRK